MLEDLLPGKEKGRESWRGSETGERKGGIGGGGGGGGGGGRVEIERNEEVKKKDIAVESHQTQDTGLCAQKYMYLEASEHTPAVILHDSSPMARTLSYSMWVQ